MISILIRSTFITLTCIAISLAIVCATGGKLAGIGLWVPIVSCLLTAFPGSTFTLWQLSRLRSLNDALSHAHIELNEAHAKLAEKARHDAMTGFLNREAFFANLDATRRKADRGVLMIVDVDHFKSINDRFGHPTGDGALLLISAAIPRAVRTHDVIGRIGGEEFGTFLRGASLEDAQQIGERLRKEVEDIDFRPKDGQATPLTVSVGGAVCGTGASIAELMHDADQLLYMAKNAGRNRVVMPNDPERIAA